MQIQSSTSAAYVEAPPSGILFGSGNPMTYPLFRRITWLSDPTSWFARRIESQIQTQRRSADRQSTIMWEDYGVTISFAGGRLVMSLFRHNPSGSVAGYVVEEAITDEMSDFRFANRGWRIRN